MPDRISLSCVAAGRALQSGVAQNRAVFDVEEIHKTEQGISGKPDG